MTNPQLAIRVQETSNGSLIVLQGPLTMNTMFPFRETVQKDVARVTFLDFSGVPYVDSAGAGMLVNAYVSRQRQGRRLALIGVVPRVRELLRITKIDSLFSFYETAGQAQSAIGSESDAVAG